MPVKLEVGGSDITGSGRLLDCALPDGYELFRFDFFLCEAVMIENMFLHGGEQRGQRITGDCGTTVVSHINSSNSYQQGRASMIVQVACVPRRSPGIRMINPS